VREIWIAGSPAPTHYVDITETFARKLAALRSHVSQVKGMDNLEEMLRTRLGRAAVQGGLPEGRLAEAFQVLQSG
jgi:LmbE family N-acetylglucosaminyl deacetylase